jgi:hypothetical protein
MDTTDEAAVFEAVAYTNVAAIASNFQDHWHDCVSSVLLLVLDRDDFVTLSKPQRAILEKASRCVDDLAKMAATFQPLALGWTEFEVRNRLLEIGRFVNSNTLVVPLDERRRRAQEARVAFKVCTGSDCIDAEELRRTIRESRGSDCIDKSVLLDLAYIADQEPVYAGRGGNRRNGRHSVPASVARMAVRLYMDAHAKPGFTNDGPMVRFVGDAAEVFGYARPSSKVVRDRWREITKEKVFGPGRKGSFAEARDLARGEAKRKNGLRSFYSRSQDEKVCAKH